MRGYKKYLSVLCAGLVLVNLSGCGAKKETEKDAVIKIGVAIYRGDDAFIASVRTNLEDGIKKQEDKIKKKINVNIEDAKNSQGSQNDQVDNFISKGYDAICVNMVDRTAAAVIVDKAKEAGIPVVFFNREPVEEDMRIWDQVYYVGTDAKEAGVMEGRIIETAYRGNPGGVDKNQDGKIQYVMLEGEPAHQDSLIRTEYSVKTVVEDGIQLEKLASDTGKWMRSLAYAKMVPWIEKYGDSIEAVICNNDEMALGAVKALEERNMLENGPLIVGIDGTKDGMEAVVNGDMYGTVRNDAKTQAEAILSLACDAALDKDPKEDVPLLRGQYVRVPHAIVTNENVENYLEEK